VQREFDAGNGKGQHALMMGPVFGLAYQGKDTVFRFIIVYSSLRVFYGNGKVTM
jgi:hypothetical protein